MSHIFSVTHHKTKLRITTFQNHEFNSLFQPTYRSTIQKLNGLAKNYCCQENLVALRYNVKILLEIPDKLWE